MDGVTVDVGIPADHIKIVWIMDSLGRTPVAALCVSYVGRNAPFHAKHVLSAETFYS